MNPITAQLQRQSTTSIVYTDVPEQFTVYPAEYHSFDAADLEDYKFKNVYIKLGKTTLVLLPTAKIELTWNKQRDPVTNRYCNTDQDALLIIEPLYLPKKLWRSLKFTGKETIQIITHHDDEPIEHTLAAATLARYNQCIELQDQLYFPEICFTGHWLEQRQQLR
jgi:hypothetical protein